MLTDEDIEALLYAQVYHGKSAEDEEAGITSGINVVTEEISNANDQQENMDNNRQQENEDQPSNLEPTPDSTQTVDVTNLQCSEISTSTASTVSLDPTQIPVFPDNEIVDQPQIHQHQFFCPGPRFFTRLQDLETKLTWSDKCEQAWSKVQEGLISEKKFFKILSRIALLQTRQRKKQAQKRQPNICSDIVYLSDSGENSDIELVSVEKNIMEEVTQITDSGDENDDIIYVEPPPVPIIDVDDDSDENEKVLEEPPIVEEPFLHIDEEASNDFLPAATTSAENFNFSLHGSEFQDAVFVRPANPTDHYETESSTSTSDFNKDSSREFSNTVKTIVFNEVDFPKDIFDDSNNLEKFGELITPKRKDKSAKSVDGLEKASTSENRKRLNPRTSSESSSESDYNASESHQHLPHLSPMVPVGSSPTKKVKHSAHDKEKTLKDNQDLITGEETSAERKSKRKRKKKNTGDKTAEDFEKGINSDNSDVQTTPHSSTRSVQLTSPTIETEEIAEKSKPSKKTGKKKNKLAGLISEIKELREETERFVGDLITSKSRTRSQKPIETGPLRKKKKKKKKKRNQNFEGVALEDLNEDVNQNQVAVEIDLFITEEQQNDILTSCDNDFNKGPGSSKVVDQETPCTKVPDENITKRKSDNSFEGNDKEEPEKNKKKKRNSSNKRNIVKDKEFVGVDQDKEVEENLIKVDEEGDILIIEQKIPLQVIDSSESEDDIISCGNLEQGLQLANVENYDKFKDFDVENIKSKMSDDPLIWQINTLDKNKVKTVHGPRCRRCRETGHIASYCPNERRLPRCNLCGLEGHEGPRCTEKVCFTCGARGNFSTVYCYKCVHQRKVRCSLCHLMGHSHKDCPDLWRRYHLTTTRGPVVVPKDNSLKSKNQRWCSGCAGNGHLEFQCRSYKWIREYPASTPIIFKYHDVYNSKNVKSLKQGIDLREVLDLHRENSDLRVKLDDKKRSSGTNRDSIAPTADTNQTDADNNTNAEPQTSQTFTEAPKDSRPENLQPSKVPSIESPLPHEVPQSLQVCEPENPVPHSSAERSLNFSHNQPDENKNKRKERRQHQNRRPNPVSLMNNRYTPYDSRNMWLNNRYETVLIPNLEMNNRPYSNQIQPFSNQIQPYSNQIRPYSNQIQPYSNQFQQLDLLNPPNILPDNYYQPPQYYDFAQDVVPWHNNIPQMPINARFNYCEPQPHVLDFSDSVPNNRHLPFTYSARGDLLDAPFTITREPSPRLSDYGEHQSALVNAPLHNQPFDGFASRQEANVENVSFDNPPIPLMSLNAPIPLMSLKTSIKPVNSSTDTEGFKLEEATIKKFLTWSIEKLQHFLVTELKKLDNIKDPDPRKYKKNLLIINHLKNVKVKSNAVKTQMHVHFKRINMYLFGVQRLEMGDKHLRFLRNFAHQPGRCPIENQRASLLEAFNYIFGGEHPHFNYMKHLNICCIKSLPKSRRAK